MGLDGGRMSAHSWARWAVCGWMLAGLAAACLVPGSQAGAAAGRPGSVLPVAAAASGFGVSAPLRSLAASRMRPAAGAPYSLPKLSLPQDAASAPTAAPAAPDAVLQAPAPLGAMPATIDNFDGLRNLSSVIPPDPDGAIGYDPATGKKYYVEFINLIYAVWDVTAAPARVVGPLSGNAIFSGLGSPCATEGQGDPVALYDKSAGRWFLSQFAFTFDSSGNPAPPFTQCIAISQTGDPTGAYYLYAFPWANGSGVMNDYPKFGVWRDGYYMSANQYSGTAWAGAGVAAFERAKMLVGDPTARMIYFNLYNASPNYGGLLPADQDGSTPAPPGAPEVFAEVDSSPAPRLSLWNFSANWSSPAASSFGSRLAPSQLLAVAAFTPLPCTTTIPPSTSCIPQPGGAPLLDGVGDRLMYRLAYRNFGGYQSLVVNHTVVADGADRAGIRWYELRSTGGSWSLYQQGTFAPQDGNYRWMGSAAMDRNGDLAVGYSISSLSLYPSIRYAGRLASDPLGSLAQGEAAIVSGSGSQGSSLHRWGDYSLLSIDPQDDCTFWYVQEYYPANSQAGWQTRIASFRFPSCEAPPAGAVRVYLPLVQR